MHTPAPEPQISQQDNEEDEYNDAFSDPSSEMLETATVEEQKYQLAMSSHSNTNMRSLPSSADMSEAANALPLSVAKSSTAFYRAASEAVAGLSESHLGVPTTPQEGGGRRPRSASPHITPTRLRGRPIPSPRGQAANPALAAKISSHRGELERNQPDSNTSGHNVPSHSSIPLNPSFQDSDHQHPQGYPAAPYPYVNGHHYPGYASYSNVPSFAYGYPTDMPTDAESPFLHDGLKEQETIYAEGDLTSNDSNPQLSPSPNRHLPAHLHENPPPPPSSYLPPKLNVVPPTPAPTLVHDVFTTGPVSSAVATHITNAALNHSPPSGRPTKETLVFIDNIINQINVLIQIAVTTTKFPRLAFLNRLAPEVFSLGNTWNGYQQYFKVNTHKELARLPNELQPDLSKPIENAVISVSYAAFIHHHGKDTAAKIINTFMESQVLLVEHTVAERKRAFLNHVTSLQTLINRKSSGHNFETIIITVGAVVNQDQGLTAVLTSPGLKDVLPDRFNLNDDLAIGLVATHAYNNAATEASKEYKAPIPTELSTAISSNYFTKTKKRPTASRSPSAFSHGSRAPSEAPSTASASMRASAKTNEDEAELKNKFEKLAAIAETTFWNNDGLKFNYKPMTKILLKAGYEFKNWPKAVQKPDAATSKRGIGGLKEDERNILLAAFDHPTSPLTVVKMQVKIAPVSKRATSRARKASTKDDELNSDDMFDDDPSEEIETRTTTKKAINDDGEDSDTPVRPKQPLSQLGVRFRSPNNRSGATASRNNNPNQGGSDNQGNNETTPITSRDGHSSARIGDVSVYKASAAPTRAPDKRPLPASVAPAAMIQAASLPTKRSLSDDTTSAEPRTRETPALTPLAEDNTPAMKKQRHDTELPAVVLGRPRPKPIPPPTTRVAQYPATAGPSTRAAQPPAPAGPSTRAPAPGPGVGLGPYPVYAPPPGSHYGGPPPYPPYGHYPHYPPPHPMHPSAHYPMYSVPPYHHAHPRMQAQAHSHHPAPDDSASDFPPPEDEV